MVELVGRRQSCRPRESLRRRDEVELAAAVRKARRPVRVPGTGHSFTPLNATDGTLIDLSAFIGLQGLRSRTQVATIAAATPLWEIGSLLHPMGYALKNMGDIDRQTLAGAVATGTHGTGRTLGSLSAEVAGFRLLLANGEVIHCSREENADIFCAGRTAMGMLGVMTEIDMHVRPVYKLVSARISCIPIDELFRQLDGLVARQPAFRVLLVSLHRHRGLQGAQRNRGQCPARVTAPGRCTPAANARAADEYVFAGVNELIRYMPVLTKPAQRFLSRLMPRKETRALEPRDVPQPAHRALQRNGICRALRKGRRHAARNRRDDPQAAHQHRISHRIPNGGGRRRLAEPVLSARKRHDCRASIPQRSRRSRCSRRARRSSATMAGGRIGASSTPVRRDELAALYPQVSRISARCARSSIPKGKFLNDHWRALFGDSRGFGAGETIGAISLWRVTGFPASAGIARCFQTSPQHTERGRCYSAFIELAEEAGRRAGVAGRAESGRP